MLILLFKFYLSSLLYPTHQHIPSCWCPFDGCAHSEQIQKLGGIVGSIREFNYNLINSLLGVRNLPLLCTTHMVWTPCMLWNLIVCLVRQPLKPDDHVLTCWISGPRCSFVGRQWRVIGVLANLPYAPSEGDPQRDMQICRLKLDTEMTWTCLRVLALKNKCVLQGLCPGSRRARQNRLWVL